MPQPEEAPRFGLSKQTHALVNRLLVDLYAYWDRLSFTAEERVLLRSLRVQKQIAMSIVEAYQKGKSDGRASTEDAVVALELIQGFNFKLDDSPHGKEIRRRAEEALERFKGA